MDDPPTPELPEGTVTVLFTDVVGSTALTNRLGDEDARSLFREVEDVTRAQLVSHGGIEVKGLGDGLMIAFSSARRAVACAIDIQRALARRNRGQPDRTVQVRSGLNTGEVIREEADLFGATVNAAARIASEAGAGEILIPEEVRVVLGRTQPFDLEAHSVAQLKGFEGVWQLYAVHWRERSTPELVEAPFVDRETELASVETRIEAAIGGQGGTVLVAGEAGIGKTRFSDRVAEQARSAGMLVLVGHCYEGGDTSPFLPLIEVLHQATRIVPPEALRSALGSDAAEIAQLMPQLRRIYDDIGEPVELPTEQAKRHLVESVRAFFERAAAVQPVLLMWEDLHWADAASTDLFDNLARSAGDARLLLMGTYRDTEVARTPFADSLERIIKQPRTHRIKCGPLSRSGVAEMLAGLGGSRPPGVVVDLFVRETDGLPFFIEEVFRFLGDAGDLLDEAGDWRSVQVGETDVPDSVALVVAQRLERLSPACRQLVASAAASGRASSWDLLHALSPADSEEFLDSLDEAERSSILVPVAQAGEDHYRFAHELTRQAVLRSCTLAERRRLHLAVARAMEQVYASDLETHVAQIAHHQTEAGFADPEAAVRFLRWAGEQASASRAYAEAAQLYASALRAAEAIDRLADADRYDLLMRHGSAQTRAGAQVDAMASLERASDVARGMEDSVSFAQAAVEFEDAYLASGIPRAPQDDPSVRLQREALQWLGDDDSALRARVLGGLARAEYFLGKREEALDLSAEAVAMARRSGDSIAELAALHSRRIALAGPEASELLDVSTELVRQAERAGNIELAVDGRQWRIFALTALGRLDDARAEIDEYEAAVHDLGQPTLLIYPPIVRGMFAFIDGRLDEAEALALRMLEQAEETQSAVADPVAWSFITRVRIEQGRYVEAEVEIRRLAAQYPHPNFPEALAEVELGLGRVEAARAGFRSLMADFDHFPVDQHYLSLIGSLARLAHRLDDRDAGMILFPILEEYRGLIIVGGTPSQCLGSCAHYLGLCLELVDRQDEALEAYEEALAANRSIDGSTYVARTAFQYGLLLAAARPEQHARAQELLGEAHDLAQDLRMTALEQQASEALAGLD